MEPHTPNLTRIAPELVEALDPADVAAVEHALAESDQRLGTVLAHWAAARKVVAKELAAAMPPGELLVLYALSDTPDDLTPAEEQRVAQAAARVEAAMHDHPALQHVVAGIRRDRDAFYAMWEAGTMPTRRAADRAPSRTTHSRARPSQRIIWRSAVALAVVLFAVALIVIAQREAGFETVRTAAEETRTIRLPDGSDVQLGPDSELAFRMDPRRHVRLTGEALFDVVPGRSEFVVETDAAWVTVLGTTFGVRADAGGTEVVLVQGSVALTGRLDRETGVVLAPGQQGRVVGGLRPEEPRSVDVSDALAWTGTWFFRATPLTEIAERLSRHYDVRIEVPEDLAHERITGSFAQEAPVEETLQTLASALGIRVERAAPGTYRFTAASS